MTTPESDAKSVDRFLRELDVRIRARYPLIAINTYEEDRVRDALLDLVFQERHKEKPLYFWSRSSGLQKVFDAKEGLLQTPTSVGDTEDPHFVNELNHLKTEWIPRRRRWIDETEKTQDSRDRAQEALDRVVHFVGNLEREHRGEI